MNNNFEFIQKLNRTHDNIQRLAALAAQNEKERQERVKNHGI